MDSSIGLTASTVAPVAGPQGQPDPTAYAAMVTASNAAQAAATQKYVPVNPNAPADNPGASPAYAAMVTASNAAQAAAMQKYVPVNPNAPADNPGASTAKGVGLLAVLGALALLL